MASGKNTSFIGVFDLDNDQKRWTVIKQWLAYCSFLTRMRVSDDAAIVGLKYPTERQKIL